jgi:DNA-binding protein HU-beta
VTKQEFVETLAERCDLSKADANRALNAILDSLTESMSDGEEVSFTGFGKFLSQRRRAREAVNPQDPSKKIKVRAANVPKFRPGKALRQAVAELPVTEGASSRPAASSGNGADRASSGGTTATRGTSTEPGEWRPLADRH